MIVNYLLIVLLLVLFAGLGIDAGFLQGERSRLDFCARAAAVSMTLAWQRGFSSTDILAAGRVTAQFNGYTDGVNGVNVTYEMPPSNGTYAGVAGASRVIIVKRMHNSFMSIAGGASSMMTADYTHPAVTAVDLSPYYNRWDIFTNYTHISHGGVDNYTVNYAAFSANILEPVRMLSNVGPLLSWRGYLFFPGPPNVPDAVAQSVIPLPGGLYSQLLIVTVTAIGSTTSVTFTVTYSDGSTVARSFATRDWCKDQFTNNSGSDPVAGPPYRLMNVQDDNFGPSYIHNVTNFMTGHSIPLDNSRTVKQVALPTQTGPEVTVLAMDLIR